MTGVQTCALPILGGNGSGKSSLIKAILAQTAPQEIEANHRIKVIPEVASGQVVSVRELIVSYVSQETSMLKGTLSVYARERGLDEGLFKAMLAKLDFNAIQFEKDMVQFSEGQKKKVLLAASICDRAHLYIWDEPLNYVDVLSRIQIENMILTYKPTMVFVEHDQAFIEHIATQVIQL